MSAKNSVKTSIFIDDAENIDPNTLNLSSKRKRSIEDDDFAKGSPKPLKTSRIALTTHDTNITPRLLTPRKIAPATPRSAPILKPAGRSPPPKSIRTSSRRSTIAKGRPEPGNKRGVARPFSLATALAQTKAPTPKSKSKAPASWFFDIHVDSEHDEMTNLMQHSTGVLDISDDEGKASITEGRGKENVPPAELGIDLPPSRQVTALAAATAARKAFKMDEDRAPLGELNAADYYPEDCNAFSYAVVYDGESENGSENKKSNVPVPPSQAAFTPAIEASIASLLETVVPSKPAAETEAIEDDAKTTEDKTGSS